MPRLHGRGNPITSWSGHDYEANLNQWLAYDCDYQRLLRLMHPHQDMSLLDIGCGDGQVLMLARQLNLQATGIETKPEAAAVSQKNAPEATIVLGSPQAIPFDQNCFDLVTCFGVMEFFLDPDQGLQEIYRVLKPGGRACIVLPNGDYGAFRSERIILADQGLDAFYSFEKWKTKLRNAHLMVGDVRFNHQQQIVSTDHTDWIVRFKQWSFSLLVKFFPRSLSSHFIYICHKLS